MAKPNQRADEGLYFNNVSVEINGRHILLSLSGQVSPGEVLAIMGPSGSGKTTLLNAVSGYGTVSVAPGSIVTLNGEKLGGGDIVWNKVSYVLQNDVFFPNLTLKETLTYSALLRLPREISFKEKLARVSKVIDQLQLSECSNTYIGDFMYKGLSGGEKKRVSIACELLTEPVMLLLDEPTTGLDSSNALTVVRLLCDLAKNEGKIVLLTIHQPSSRIFHMFNQLLLIVKGKNAYSGAASQALGYFSHLGINCAAHYNPADFMLEAVAVDETRMKLIGPDPEQHEMDDTVSKEAWWSRCFNSIKKRCCCCDVEAGKPKEPAKSNSPTSEATPLLSYPGNINQESNSTASVDYLRRRWPTRWYWQFLVLTVRTFRRARRTILSVLRMIQTLCLAIICSLLWFQVPYQEAHIFDRYGYLYFMIAYWSIDSVTSSTLSMPADNEVVSKDRASRSYYLSAYYMAKFVTELFPVLVDPSVFLIVTYWAGGIGGPVAFFGVWAVLIVNTFAAQALGVLLGSVLMDMRTGLVAAQVGTLAFILVGGFYVRHFRFWLEWVPYTSFITYTFHAMLQFVFTEHVHFSCNTPSSYEVCSMANATISGTDVLQELNATNPLYINFVALFAFGVGFRILGYLALRFLH